MLYSLFVFCRLMRLYILLYFYICYYLINCFVYNVLALFLAFANTCFDIVIYFMCYTLFDCIVALLLRAQ